MNTLRCSNTCIRSRSKVTSCGHLVQVGGGDVGGVVAVAAVRLGEAVHVQQLPVGHLTVGVEDLLTSADRLDTYHSEAVLQEEEGGGREIFHSVKLMCEIQLRASASQA